MPHDRATTAADQPSFEAALKRLEEIVHALEEGNLGLNESLGALRGRRQAAAAVVRTAGTGRAADRTPQRRRCRGQPDHSALRRHGHLRRRRAGQTARRRRTSPAAEPPDRCSDVRAESGVPVWTTRPIRCRLDGAGSGGRSASTRV